MKGAALLSCREVTGLQDREKSGHVAGCGAGSGMRSLLQGLQKEMVHNLAACLPQPPSPTLTGPCHCSPTWTPAPWDALVCSLTTSAPGTLTGPSTSRRSPLHGAPFGLSLSLSSHCPSACPAQGPEGTMMFSMTDELNSPSHPPIIYPQGLTSVSSSSTPALDLCSNISRAFAPGFPQASPHKLLSFPSRSLLTPLPPQVPRPKLSLSPDPSFSRELKTL